MVFIKLAKYSILVYQHANGSEPFTDWINGLDKKTQARISARISRFEDGYFGDHKSLGDGIIEARFFFGAGYRVYYAIYKNQHVLLLIGGDKSTQIADIIKAKEYLQLFLEVKNANKKS